MRLDHIAYRVKDRHETANLVTEIFGYTIDEEFNVDFDDGSTARCCAMTPPEKKGNPPWMIKGANVFESQQFLSSVFHMAPEIFISDGDSNSIVGNWVRDRGGVGGIHHIAYQVDDIDSTFNHLKDNGVEFLSENIIKCPSDDMNQKFTKPLDLIGCIIIELIQRGDKGFCRDSVKDLMESTDKVSETPEETTDTASVDEDKKEAPSHPATLNWLYGSMQ